MSVENLLPQISEELTNGLSKAEVEAWAKSLIKAIDKHKKIKLEKAFSDILNIVKSVEVPAEELIAMLNKNDALFATGNYENGNPKKLYKNPNTNETWCGIGRRPVWYVECLNQGYTKEDLIVSSQDKTKADFNTISAILSELIKGNIEQNRLNEIGGHLANLSKDYLDDSDTTETTEPVKTPKKTTATRSKKTLATS